MLEEIHEECGVIGIFNGENVVRNVTMGLYALQHRGQESAGFAVTDGDKIRVRKSMGLVSTLLQEHNVDECPGNTCIGHVRYSTTGASTLANAQPILVSCKWGQLAVVHNGNITNATELRQEMENEGHIFQTTSDSEILLHEIARTEADLKVHERTRLAVELHDTLVQNMTGVAIALRTRNYDLAAKTLDFCRKDLRNCLWDLRNLTLDDEDINAAIRKTLTPHAADAELHVRFNVPREKFTDNTAHAILCILRELTINAVRHGAATAIWVAGSTEGDLLLFSVRDNGQGFDPDAAPGMEQGHFGLQGIRDRVEGFEGNLSVESSHSGTKVTIALRMSQMEGIELK